MSIKQTIKHFLIRLFEVDTEYKELQSYCDRLNVRFDKLSLENSQLLSDNESLTHNFEELQSQYNTLLSEYNSLKDDKLFEEQLEQYWNNVRVPVSYVYNARPIFLFDGDYQGHVNLDPRVFASISNDPNIPVFKGTYDEIASQALTWVNKHIKYVSEGKEFWQFYFETLFRKQGDCEDGAILMHAIMLKSGIPYWRIRLNAGDVKGGGHCYVTYLREKDNDWYVLDWCYWYIESKDYGLPWKAAEKYYSDSDGKQGFGIWFSFNNKYIFGDLPKEI